MAITDQLINQIKNDFYQGPDYESLRIEPEHPFWDWFKENSKNYMLTNSHNEFLSEDYLSGRCFGNSQILAFESGLSYMEGFARATNRYIFHGFNLKSDEAVDVTAFNFPEAFIEYLGGLPIIYIGIEIPLFLIKQENSESIINKRKNIDHLIFKLFSEQKDTSV